MVKNIPLTRVHSYNVSVAADVGINAAVIFYNICYWVEENMANDRNFINGDYWTYNTVSAFKELFPEMTYEQVRNALRKLEENNYIKSAFLNEDTRDRTKWYSVVDKSKWIMNTKCICEFSQMENGNPTDVYNIYNNKNTKTNNKQSNNKQSNKKQHTSPKGDDKYTSQDCDGDTCNPNLENISRLHQVSETCIDEDCREDFLNVATEFLKKYQIKFGKPHRVLSVMAYENIAERYMSVPDTMHSDENYEFKDYRLMIEEYFKQEWKDGIELSMSHFFSDEIRGRLYERVCI